MCVLMYVSEFVTVLRVKIHNVDFPIVFLLELYFCYSSYIISGSDLD